MSNKNFKDKKLTDFIITYENMFSEEECNQIIKEYENDNWASCGTYDEASKNERTAQVIPISTPNVIEKNKTTRLAIDNLVHNKVHSCIKEYKKIVSYIDINSDSGFDLLRYKKNNLHTEHADTLPGPMFDENGALLNISLFPRQVSCSILLNNQFTGGNLTFFGGTHSVNQTIGSITLFPSNFLFSHQIHAVSSGMRYSIVTWFIRHTPFVQ